MRRNRPTSALAPLLLLGVVIAGSSSLGDESTRTDASTVPYWWGAGEYISDSDLDFVVARVVSVRDSNATVANPPRLLIRVEKVLRGKLTPGKLAARWVPELIPPFRCGNETVSEQEGWDRYYRSRLPGPTVGRELLLAGAWNSDSKTWDVSEVVRYAYSPAMQALVLNEVHRADSTKKAATTAEERRIKAELAQDRQIRSRADIDALCRASTDVLIGVVNPESRLDVGTNAPLGTRLDVRTRLWSREQTPRAARADSFMGYPPRPASDFLTLSPQDQRQYRCRVQYAARPRIPDESPGMAPPLLLFLKRGPFDPGGSGMQRYRLADHDNALLLADSAVVKQVRRAIARISTGEKSAPTPFIDCGATLADLIGLPAHEHQRLRCKIAAVKYYRASWSDRVQPFIFGAGGTDDDTRSSVPCSMEGELYWNDYSMEPYWVPVSPQQMEVLVRGLEREFASTRQRETGSAVLTVWGPLAEGTREFEILLGSNDVGRLGSVLTTMAQGDSLVSWRVNYLKFCFGPPLAPDSSWHMRGYR